MRIGPSKIVSWPQRMQPMNIVYVVCLNFEDVHKIAICMESMVINHWFSDARFSDEACIQTGFVRETNGENGYNVEKYQNGYIRYSILHMMLNNWILVFLICWCPSSYTYSVTCFIPCRGSRLPCVLFSWVEPTTSWSMIKHGSVLTLDCSKLCCQTKFRESFSCHSAVCFHKAVDLSLSLHTMHC